MVSHSCGITDYIRLLYKATIYHLFIDNHSGWLFRLKMLFLPDLITDNETMPDSVRMHLGSTALQNLISFTSLTETATVFLSQLDCSPHTSPHYQQIYMQYLQSRYFSALLIPPIYIYIYSTYINDETEKRKCPENVSIVQQPCDCTELLEIAGGADCRYSHRESLFLDRQL